MRKTTKYQVESDDLCVDSIGLQDLLHCGRKTATEIGEAAGARIVFGRRVLWNVEKIKKYLNEISE